MAQGSSSTAPAITIASLCLDVGRQDDVAGKRQEPRSRRPLAWLCEGQPMQNSKTVNTSLRVGF